MPDVDRHAGIGDPGHDRRQAAQQRIEVGQAEALAQGMHAQNEDVHEERFADKDQGG